MSKVYGQLERAQLENLTTTQRDALTASRGQVIFNTTLNQSQIYTGTAWISIDSAGIRAITTSGNILASDSDVTSDATAGPVTATLPSASSSTGKRFTLIRIDASANNTTLAAGGGDTINGAASVVLQSQYAYVTVVSNGSTKWFVESGNSIPNQIHTASVTTTYTAFATDDYIYATAAGGSYTITLPDPTQNVGKIYRVKRTDATIGNKITISPNLDGASRKLCTQNESVTVISNGTTYDVIEHKTGSGIISSLAFVPSTNWGSVTALSSRTYRREDTFGGFCFFITAASDGTAATAYITLPTGITIDSSKYPSGSYTKMGDGHTLDASSSGFQAGAVYTIALVYDGSDTSKLWLVSTVGATTSTYVKKAGNFYGTSVGLQLRMSDIAVTDWWA